MPRWWLGLTFVMWGAACGDDAAPRPEPAPAGTTFVEGTLVPPHGRSPRGWAVTNRFGATQARADGSFTLPIADEGMTLSVATPPDTSDAAVALLTMTVRTPLTPATAGLTIDARSTAAAALLLHPRAVTAEAWRLGPLLELAQGLPSVEVLAGALAATFEAGWPRVPSTEAAYRVALDELLRRAAPAWDVALATDLPADPPGYRSVRTGTPLVALEPVYRAGDALALVPLPGRPSRLTVLVTPLDAAQASLEEVLAGVVPPALAAPTAGDPDGLALAEGLYMIDVGTDVPASLSLADARARSAWTAAGAPDPHGATDHVVAVAEALAAITPSSALVADPLHPLAAVLDPRRGPASESLVLVVGDPFTPRLEVALDGPPAAGAALGVSGRHLGALLVTDASGRAHAPVRAGDRSTVPAGLAGALELVAEAPGGSARVSLGALAPTVERVTPDRLAKGLGPTTVTVIGQGFAPGLEVDLGGARVIVPEDTTPTLFDAVVDPDGLAPSTGPAALRVVGAPIIVAGPERLARGATAAFTLAAVPPGLVVRARAGGDTLPLPLRLVTGERVHVDTRDLPLGTSTLELVAPGGTTTTTLAVEGAAPAHAREIMFTASDAQTRQIQLATALAIANGESPAAGEFWLVDTNVMSPQGWYCPLDIRPDTTVIAEPCNHFSGVCNDLWSWGDTRDPSTWLTVTPPPGRRSTGAARCPPVAGPASWTEVPRADLHDRVASAGAVHLAGQVVRGPHVELVLPEARGGGLSVRPPLPAVAPAGTRSEVTLDLVVGDATATADRPVVLLDGVTGVHVRRLVIDARAGACAAGLVIRDSQDVQVDDVEVVGCDVAVHIIGSRDVRVDGAIIASADIGITLQASEDVALDADVDAREVGVHIGASRRVALTGSVGGAHEVGVRLDGVGATRVGPLTVGGPGVPVGRGVVVAQDAGVNDDVALVDLRVPRALGDGVVVEGGARLAIVDALVGEAGVSGAIGGVGLRVGAGAEHDLDIDGLVVAGTSGEGVRLSGAGRVHLARARVTMATPAGPCALTVDNGSGARLDDLALAGRLCTSVATDLAARDVTADEVTLSQSAGLDLTRVTTGEVAVQSGAGIALVALEAERVRVVGPLVDQADPIVLVDAHLLATDDALVVSDTRVPVRARGLEAPEVIARRHAGLTLEGGRVARLVLEGAGPVEVRAGAEVDEAVVDAGALRITGAVARVVQSAVGTTLARGARIGERLVASGGRVSLVATTMPDGAELWARDARVTVEGGALPGLTLERGAATITGVSVSGDVQLIDVDDARVSDVDLSGRLVVGDGARARLARVHASAIERVGTTRELRVVGASALVPRPGDPQAVAARVGDRVVVEAAPEHALVELHDGERVVARAFTTAGRALLDGVGEGPLTLSATLFDGTSGPDVALDAEPVAACSGSAPPEDVLELVAAPAVCPDVDADLVTSADCRLGARVEGDAIVVTALASGVVTSYPIGDADARDVAFTRDGASLWHARREHGDTRWSLARLDLGSGDVAVVLASADDALWPAPSPDGARIAFSSCPGGEAGACHLALLDVESGAASVPALGGWPAALACDDRRPRWLDADASAVLGDGLLVERRGQGVDGAAPALDIVTPLGLPRWRVSVP